MISATKFARLMLAMQNHINQLPPGHFEVAQLDLDALEKWGKDAIDAEDHASTTVDLFHMKIAKLQTDLENESI